MSTISAYPLQWPEGWKRTPADRRAFARFGTHRRAAGHTFSSKQNVTVAEATSRIIEELTRWAILRDDLVISTNLKLRLDGLPRSDQARPADPGAAVYWIEPTSERRCIAIDRYTTVEGNLAAIAATLDAMRAIERHGGAEILARAFTGFVALPAPGAAREWWEVLGVPRASRREDVKAAYRRLASEAHPDKPGGSHERMAALNAAQEAALLECFQ